ncbi:hypothetical protein CWE09_14005 [Aliidiomarina minuta]|uniref:Uncharacterized protein n=1 Tax=Aliidiomarina minuta TaxID=880057 RepID=A0A432W1E1_9GAMM|nr:hypothetical protein [Aliidiomarina minuta]RUO23040.1 hypothetical protein CWE09_14005 [Aliidiomarina minuta]
MNSLLLTFALFSNPAPAIDVSELIDINAWRQELHVQIVREAAEVSELMKNTVREGINQLQVIEIEEQEGVLQTAAAKGQ